MKKSIISAAILSAVSFAFASPMVGVSAGKFLSNAPQTNTATIHVSIGPTGTADQAFGNKLYNVYFKSNQTNATSLTSQYWTGLSGQVTKHNIYPINFYQSTISGQVYIQVLKTSAQSAAPSSFPAVGMCYQASNPAVLNLIPERPAYITFQNAYNWTPTSPSNCSQMP